jgi:hypothetical protein
MDNTNNQNSIDEPQTLNKDVVQMNVDEAQGTIRSKASWFFWIAGLSVINTILSANGGYFIVGLAVSQVIDAIVIEETGSINYFISLFAPTIFALIGYFAFNLNRWAFIAGAILYLLDSLIYLYAQEWFAAAFHLFVLYKLYQGYRTITEYEEEKARLS